MASFPCPYLNGEVELTDERERHIAERHPDLLPVHRSRVADTLAAPDEVRKSTRLASARLFVRQFDSILGSKHVVVVVVTDATPVRRYWIVTAYLARRLAEGEPEWQRS